MSSPHLHVYFFPFLAPGHTIPLVEMARKFARHDTNIKATLILSHLNAPRFHDTIQRDRQQGFNINIREIQFPGAQVGLAEGCECLSSVTSPHMSVKFIKALELLKQSVRLILEEDRPDCLVSDFIFSWTNEVAANLQIPRIVFHGAGFFPLCVYHSLVKHKPFMGLESDSETFVVPGLPDVVKMTRRQLPDYIKDNLQSPSSKLIQDSTEKESEGFGVVVNSFRELEPAYVDHYKSIIGERVWHVGPVSLCNKDHIGQEQRGNNNKTMTVKKDCLDWLSMKEPSSVVYVCFGTVSLFSTAQMREIAVGLESCGRDFIWVVNKDDESGEWLPEGFEGRVGEKGLVVRSWAPQVLILEHASVGGFLTHCGWNSLIEGVSAGKPMITWPISSEQFDNEKLVTEVLKIGVGVGSVEWSRRTDAERCLIKEESIGKAVNRVMVCEEGLEMRNRVKALSAEAKKAIEKGGSSYNDLDSLLEKLRLCKSGNGNK